MYFANGSILQRHSDAKSWTLIEGNVKTPWHGEVYVTDQEAIISSGAVADLFKLDGSHIRYLNGQIVMIVTMCGDVFEFEYEGKTLSEVKLDSQPYIQHKKGKWQLAGARKTIYGVPHVSVHGFSFDAQEKHRYLDRYLTNGNLTTMRDGMYKFTFGAARV